MGWCCAKLRIDRNRPQYHISTEYLILLGDKCPWYLCMVFFISSYRCPLQEPVVYPNSFLFCAFKSSFSPNLIIITIFSFDAEPNRLGYHQVIDLFLANCILILGQNNRCRYIPLGKVKYYRTCNLVVFSSLISIGLYAWAFFFIYSNI